MALPTFVAAGAVNSGTGAITFAQPAGILVGDVLLGFVETDDQALIAGGDWALLLNAPVSLTNETRLYVFYKVAVATTGQVLPVSDSGDHQGGAVLAFRGASTTPWNITVQSSNQEVTTDPTLTITGGTTTVNDCLIVAAVAVSNSSTGARFASWTNANLGSVTERFDNSWTAGNGGGIGIATGTLATAGAIGNTTTVNTNVNPGWAALVIAIPPPDPPANDTFASATSITVPATEDTYSSTTRDASRQASEANSGALIRTVWWSYVAPYRHILEIELNTAGAATLKTLGYAMRGATVSTLSPYASPLNHYGAAGGRGVDGSIASGFSSHFLDSERVQFQVDPGTTVMVQTGLRHVTGSPPVVDYAYDVIFNEITPPSNDDFTGAMVLSGTGGSESFDLAGATGDPNWAADQMVFEGSVTLSAGDIFYSITTTEVKTFAWRLQKNVGTDDLFEVKTVLYSGTDITDLEDLVLTRGPLASEEPGYDEYVLDPFVNYYLVVFQTHQMNQRTVRWDGILEWDLLDPPPNDDLADAEVLTSATTGNNSVVDTRGSTSEVLETQDLMGGGGEQSIWFSFLCPQDGWYTFTIGALAGNNWSATSWRGTDYTDLEPAGFWNKFTAVDDEFVLAMRAGDTYYIRISADPSWDLEDIDWVLTVAQP